MFNTQWRLNIVMQGQGINNTCSYSMVLVDSSKFEQYYKKIKLKNVRDNRNLHKGYLRKLGSSDEESWSSFEQQYL